MAVEVAVVWFREHFNSLPEAEAFRFGLQWGDEPQWFVDTIEPCRHNENMYDVVFADMANLDEYDRSNAPEPESVMGDTCWKCGGKMDKFETRGDDGGHYGDCRPDIERYGTLEHEEWLIEMERHEP